ncbi:MAG: nickel pincer cofactor biosynthesis protein LarB, partial [Ktedonobacteraceae bacterium]
MNHDANEQLEWLGQVLSQGIFAHNHTNNDFGQNTSPATEEVSPARIEIRPDPGRERRKGVPEVIFGETKETAQVIAMARSLLVGSGLAIISRVRPETLVALRQEFQAYTLHVREASRALVIYQPGYMRVSTGGRVGVLSAGTSDIPVAEEAALIAEEMGCQVTCIYDVGVAGLHRLLEPLRDLLAGGVDVI